MPSSSEKRASRRAPVILLGSSLTTLGCIRILARRRIPVYVHSVERDIDAKSRWFQPLPLPPGTGRTPDGLSHMLTSLSLERAVLMPCTDEWSRAVGRLDPKLRERFPSCVPRMDVLQTLTDKGRFLEAADRFGVLHPMTILLNGEGDLEALSEDVFPRVFLKPRDSEAFYRVFGRKATLVENREDAIRKLREFNEAGLPCVLQEYVPGPPTNHYFIDGFADHSGRIVARFARRRVRMYPPEFGNSSCTVSVPLGEVAPAVTMLDRLLKGLSHTGIFSAEFKIDARTGLFNLLEVNSRPWWYIEFAAYSGVDVCSLAYRDALGLPIQPIERYETGRPHFHVVIDSKACRAAYRAGDLSLGAWIRSWWFGRDIGLAGDDPLPGVRNLADMTASDLSGFIRGRAQHMRPKPVSGEPARIT
jgi:D-aspartate ligase